MTNDKTFYDGNVAEFDKKLDELIRKRNNTRILRLTALGMMGVGALATMGSAGYISNYNRAVRHIESNDEADLVSRMEEIKEIRTEIDKSRNNALLYAGAGIFTTVAGFCLLGYTSLIREIKVNKELDAIEPILDPFGLKE